MKKNNGREFESTYVIAMGNKNSCHEDVLSYIHDDLKILEGMKSKPIYSRAKKQDNMTTHV